jgi:hypothetical protein
MVQTYTIKKFSDIIEIGTTFGKNWYRGHSKEFRNLIPKVFRIEYHLNRAFNSKYESSTVEEFKRVAPSIINNLPSQRDYISWLFIMQHHGFPTRLLDWSENILVALFFSILDSYDDNGEIWSMYPLKLNEYSGIDGIALPDHSKIRYLSKEPFHNSPDKLLKMCSLSERPNIPIALLPSLFLPRITGQLSAFTIHPETDGQNSIDKIINDDASLVRYVIPKELKSEFEEKLRFLGISYRTLFPDLEGLSSDFKRKGKYLGWNQPLHPEI